MTHMKPTTQEIKLNAPTLLLQASVTRLPMRPVMMAGWDDKRFALS